MTITKLGQTSAFAAFVLGTSLALSTTAHAVPVKLDYVGVAQLSTDFAPPPDGVVADGIPITITAIFDNGGTDLNDQVWQASDFISAVFKTGDFIGNLIGFSFESGSFSTDLNGDLSFLSLNIEGGPTSFDNQGGTGGAVEFFFNGRNDVIFGGDPFFSVGAVSPPNLTNTTISLVNAPAAVPLPPAALLLLGGVASLAGLRKSRKALA